MNTIQTIASLITGSGILTLLLSLPLICRRIPPNALYGIRTRAAFSSESDWYRINAIGGRYLAFASLIIISAGVVGFFLPVSLLGTYGITAAFVTLVSALLPCLRLCFMRPLSPK